MKTITLRGDIMNTEQDYLATIETELNNMLWHIKVCEESKSELCRLILTQHIRAAKLAFDKYDNGE